jgi:hypothetical protein
LRLSASTLEEMDGGDDDDGGNDDGGNDDGAGASIDQWSDPPVAVKYQTTKKKKKCGKFPYSSKKRCHPTSLHSCRKMKRRKYISPHPSLITSTPHKTLPTRTSASTSRHSRTRPNIARAMRIPRTLLAIRIYLTLRAIHPTSHRASPHPNATHTRHRHPSLLHETAYGAYPRQQIEHMRICWMRCGLGGSMGWGGEPCSIVF